MSGFEYGTAPTLVVGAVPTEPVPYLVYVLAQQGLELSPDYLLLGGPGPAATDLVNGATHTASGGALVGEPVDSTSRLVLSSPLVLGRFRFPSASARIDADDVATLEVGDGSGLVAAVIRYPTRPSATAYSVGKREAAPDNIGWEFGLDPSAILTNNNDVIGGGPPMGALLSRDEAADSAWRCEVWYRDASRNLIQICSTEELGDQKTIPGDLTSSASFSIGAVRGATGIPGAEIVLVAAWLGAQVEGLFGDGLGFRPNELGKNIMHHVAVPIWADVAGAISVGGLA